MATFPLILPDGAVAVYGMGTSVSAVDLSQPEANSPLRFGSIYHVWSGGETYIYGSDQIMFNEKDVICRVVSGSIPYTIVPARLATKQNIPL